MLDGIDPWGLESLNNIAAMFLGTAVPPRLWRACGYAASGMGVAVDCS